MYRCCIFDLDGTLLNTIETLAYCTNHVLEKFDYPAIPTEEYRFFVGDGYKKQVERALYFVGNTKLKDYETVCQAYMEFFAEHCTDKLFAYDGIVELLEELKKRGMKIACFSNKPHQQTIDSLRAGVLLKLFDAVRGQVEGIPVKPDPTGAKMLLEELGGITPEEVLYLGDTNTDMKTGKNAGFTTVGVTWGFRPEEELKEENPDYIIHRPAELLNILANDNL